MESFSTENSYNFKDKKFKIASRTSQLALQQVYEVIDLLCNVKELGLNKENFEIVPVSNSEGDQNLKDPLYLLGGVGVFTKNVEKELKNNNAHFAVHSLKDLPTEIDSELCLGAIPGLMPRCDVVIAKDQNTKLESLPKDAVIGTSSLRRASSLKYRFPHLQFKNIRGNLNTRIKKLIEGDYDALILAHAGIKRLNFESMISQFLDEKDYLHAPSQGALGVECHKSDEETKKLLSFINNTESEIRCTAERKFLNRLEGGCKLPIGVYSEIIGEEILLVGQVWGVEGNETVRMEMKGKIKDGLVGERLADEMKKNGAEEIIERVKGVKNYEIKMNEKMIEPSFFMKSETNTTIKNLSFNNGSPITKSVKDYAITTKMESDSDLQNSQAYINAMKALQKKIKKLENLLEEGQKQNDKLSEEKNAIIINLSQKIEENCHVFESLELNLKTKLSFFEKDHNELTRKNELLTQENERLKINLDEIKKKEAQNHQKNEQFESLNNLKNRLVQLEQLNKNISNKLDLNQKEKQKLLLQLNDLQEKLCQKENDQYIKKNRNKSFGYEQEDSSNSQNINDHYFSIKKELDAQIEINRQQKLLLSEKFREIEFLKGSPQVSASSSSNFEKTNIVGEISFNENMNHPMQSKKIANESLTERNNLNQYRLLVREGNSKIGSDHQEKKQSNCEVNESLKYLLTNDSFSLKAADNKRKLSLGSFEQTQKIIALEKELVELNNRHQDFAEELINSKSNSKEIANIRRQMSEISNEIHKKNELLCNVNNSG